MHLRAEVKKTIQHIRRKVIIGETQNRSGYLTLVKSRHIGLHYATMAMF